MLNEEKLEKIVIIVSIFAIACCGVLLFPQVRSFTVEVAGKILGRDLRDPNKWMRITLEYLILIIVSFGIFLVFLSKRMRNFLEKYGEKFYLYVTIGIVAMSVVVRIVMCVSCPSFWGDEADLAANIVPRNWFELLIPPLKYYQSAPIFYLFLEKAIGSLLGYSEFSLRLFSLLSFLGLLTCEMLFLKKIFNFNSYKVYFVLIMSALLPTYVWYSNELKPYMSDAFFVISAILLYFCYTQDKIKLPILITLCILFLGFSSPLIFFTGGILLSEFLVAVFKKNKKHILYIIISGIVVIVIFGLYYYWWFLPVSKFMETWWTGWQNQFGIMKKLQTFFSTFNSNSMYVWIFVPFSILGIYYLITCKNKVAYMVALSLGLAFFASIIGKWPLTGRLWLFLPAIIFIFTPIGFDFIQNKIRYRRFIHSMKLTLLSVLVVYLSVNCLTFLGNKMYLGGSDINALIFYIQEKIKDDEKLFVHRYNEAQVQFKIGYTTTKIGNVDNDNIIFGIDPYTNENYREKELQSIIENAKIYLLMPNWRWNEHDGTRALLQNYGTLTEVMNVNDTPLYYFEKTPQ
jgi:hypothetical protein